ncbi:hypothetical protein [Jeongeupia chitinilytica]|uniref:ABC transporter permease n=1 Tax=Jeongeupia chitinilytica TaxID=1041641 RepID=A0ABQ3GVH5_9NEIS|nr:hypothetical protein [Jeongeupia chitinilytica]GHD56997.1 hypothetical protein GCM10007350_05020 [Jeongeupia chitinilytica]
MTHNVSNTLPSVPRRLASWLFALGAGQRLLLVSPLIVLVWALVDWSLQ